MCFSPQADFVAGAVVVGLGVETLRLLRTRRELIVGALPLLFGLGALLGAYLLRQVTAYPVGVQEQARVIDYITHTPNDAVLGLLYAIATCGPALLSSRAYLRWFGLVSLVGLIVTAIVRFDEVTSLWCLYAAGVSALILEHFRRQRAFEARGTQLSRPVLPP